MDDRSWELLSAFFSGNISDADRRALEAWVSTSDENTRIFNEAQKLWDSTGLRLKDNDLDGNQLLQELKVRIHNGQTPRGKVIAFLKQYSLYLRVAAGICLCVVSIFIIRYATQTDQLIQSDIAIETTNEVATIYLPDSSQVWLNVNSKLIYPVTFTQRNVHLQGEAFFSVRKDSSEFTVLTDATQTKVVGTAFNISERDDSKVVLSVAKGTVIFSDRDSTQKQQPLMVRAREKAVYERKKKDSKIAKQ